MAQSWVSALAALVVLAVCGAGSEQAHMVEVHGDPDSTRLEIGVDTCNQDPRVNVRESAEEVRLQVDAENAKTRDDWADAVVVTLAEPLGTRVVVDDSTGERLQVSPAE